MDEKFYQPNVNYKSKEILTTNLGYNLELATELQDYSSLETRCQKAFAREMNRYQNLMSQNQNLTSANYHQNSLGYDQYQNQNQHSANSSRFSHPHARQHLMQPNCLSNNPRQPSLPPHQTGLPSPTVSTQNSSKSSNHSLPKIDVKVEAVKDNSNLRSIFSAENIEEWENMDLEGNKGNRTWPK